MFQKVIENYKLSLFLSSMLLLAIIGSLFWHQQQSGEFIEKGLDFKGGTQIIINDATYDQKSLEQLVRGKFGEGTIIKFSGNGQSIIIESEEKISIKDIESLLNASNVVFDSAKISRVELGAALSSAFLNQARKAVIISFIAVSLVVYVTFRKIIPSIAVMLAGIADLLTAMAGMNLFNIDLSLSTLAALLILIGYSIDTDILLSTRVLKSKVGGSVNERMTSSMKTGLTMTICAIAAMAVLYFISTSAVLDDIAIVITMGLLADIPFTWIQNVSILKWYTVVKNIE